MKNAYFILDHLASAMRLARREYEKLEHDEHWSKIEEKLWQAYYFHSKGYDEGYDELKEAARLLHDMDLEVLAALKPLPATIHTAIVEVLREEGVW